jgi:hypothetical protein
MVSAACVGMTPPEAIRKPKTSRPGESTDL